MYKSVMCAIKICQNTHNCHIIITIIINKITYIYTCIYNPHLCYMKVFLVE